MKKKDDSGHLKKNKTPVRMGITFFKVPALHRGKNCCSNWNAFQLHYKNPSDKLCVH
jgi:hypothetical protein